MCIHPRWNVISYVGTDFPLKCLYPWKWANIKVPIPTGFVQDLSLLALCSSRLATILAISTCVSDICPPSCHCSIHQSTIKSPWRQTVCSLQMLVQIYHAKRCDNQKNKTEENHTRASSKQIHPSPPLPSSNSQFSNGNWDMKVELVKCWSLEECKTGTKGACWGERGA